jgi:DNA-binding transcriptional ArsR family regulator
MMATTVEASESADVFTIGDVETLKAVAEPLRMRLLMALDEGDLTVKELSAKLDVPPTRLYYHVRILETFRLLRVASTRMVSGIEERRYAATAKSWTISDSLLTSPAVSDVLKAMFDLARVELMLALGAGGPPPGDPDGAVPVLQVTKGHMSRAQIHEFTRALGELIEKYTTLERRPGTTEYHATFAIYRANVRPDDAA